MTTPPCPRCGNAIYWSLQGFKIWCQYGPCKYGLDAPRTLVPQPDPVAAPVQGTVGRDLAADMLAAFDEWWSQARTGRTMEQRSPFVAAELMRLGWVHSSQATGGGLSGEVRATIEGVLTDAEEQCEDDIDCHVVGPCEEEFDEARLRADIKRIAAARVALAALPVRGDGPGI